MPRKNNMDLGIGKIDINFGRFMAQKNDPLKMNWPKNTGPSYSYQAGRAVGTARRAVRKIQSKYGGKQYQILTISGGVVRRHAFKDERKARAFKEKADAGEYEKVSEITEMY